MRQFAYIDLIGGNEGFCQAADIQDGFAYNYRGLRILTKTPPALTIPAKKTKIYAYHETLLDKTKETYQSPQPQLRESPALETGCGVFGATESVCYSKHLDIVP